ncbi:MAG: acyltransferase [Arcobacter sp.]|nr:MAG: acyltransferase [Arcobacter sp.]
MLRIFHRLYFKVFKKKFKKIGKNSYIASGFDIDYPEYIDIGSKTYINKDAWISISPNGNPIVSIGSDVYIGRYLTLACVNQVTISDSVMISDRCYIGDAVHGFQIKDRPIIEQEIYSAGDVSIGEGSWIGIGVSILPNVKIGKHCVIGAGSVVTKSIPDYHIVAGNPARIIKNIDFINE